MRYYLTIGLILCLWNLLGAQVSFKAVADAEKVTLDGYFEVRFVLQEARGNDFKPPNFQGFRVVSGPSKSVSTSVVNGVVSMSSSYAFTLEPRAVGKYTIDPASINVDGKIWKSNTLTIEVVKGKKRSANLNSEGEGDQNIFLRAEVPIAQVYIGQQVPLNYRIYTLSNINTVNIMSESDYQGFYAEDIRRFDQGILRKVEDDVQYTTKVIKKMALFPQQTGTLTIEPLEMRVGVAQGKLRDPRDFFFRPNIYNVNVASAPLNIEVMPLPDNAPESFTGAVGDYSFSTQMLASEVTTDDAVSIQLRVIGNGDIKRVLAPPLDLGDDFEVYEPKIKEEFTQEVGGQLQGRKIFEYIILPKRAGQFRIAPSFTYFDPATGQYMTKQAEKYTLNVAAGSKKPSIAKSPTEAIENDIRHIKSVTQLRQKGTSLFGSPLYFSLMGIPILFLIGAVAYKQVKKQQENIDPSILKNRLAQKVAQKHLSAAKAHQETGTSRAFYDEVSKALLSYVNDKLSIRNSELTKHNVRDRLNALNVDSSHIERFMQIMQTCEMALFARKDSAADMQQTYTDAADVIVNIEKTIGNS